MLSAGQQLHILHLVQSEVAIPLNTTGFSFQKYANLLNMAVEVAFFHIECDIALRRLI